MAKRETVDISMRDFPKGLWRELRSAAALSGITAREALISAVQSWIIMENVAKDTKDQVAQALRRAGESLKKKGQAKG